MAQTTTETQAHQGDRKSCARCAELLRFNIARNGPNPSRAAKGAITKAHRLAIQESK